MGALCTGYIRVVVKVSQNAPERRSGAPSKLKKAFRGSNVSISAPERSFRGPMTLFQTTLCAEKRDQNVFCNISYKTWAI